MAIIKFSNGQSVNFNGTPTQKDVEEVALRLGIKPQPAPPPQPLALDPTTHADKATFPATGNEGTLGIIGKTVGNIPASAVNFGKGVLNFFNPVSALKSAASIGTGVGEAQDEGAKLGQLAKDTALGLPKAAFETLLPQSTQDIVKAAYAFAANPNEILPTLGNLLPGVDIPLPRGSSTSIDKNLSHGSATIQNDPVGQVLPYLLMARSIAEKQGNVAQFDATISKIASPVTTPAKAVAGYAKSAVSGATKFAGSQLTGLSPRTLEQVVQNPGEFSKQAQTNITRPSLAQEVGTAISDRQAVLSDTGSEYAGIRTNTTPIPVHPDYLTNLIQKTTGLKVVDGKLQTSGSASVRLPSDVNALQSKILSVWEPEFAKGYLTAEEFLNFRTDLSKMVYNDSGVGKSTTLANLSEIMRGKVNTDLRPNVPGLAELDAQYAPQITELKQLTKGLLDKEGNLSEAAINRIANATGKGKDPLLARLEELKPGITDRIKILKAVEDIANSRENKPGTYTRAAVGVSGIVTVNPYLIVSAILSLPEIAVPLMRGVGYSSELISKTLNTLGIKGLPSTINQLPNTGLAPLAKQAEKMGVSAGLSMKNVAPKYSDDLYNAVARELSKYDSAPATVNGKPNITNVDVEFRLGQLADKVNNGALSKAEVLEGYSLLKQVGIDPLTADTLGGKAPAATFKQNLVSGKMEGSIAEDLLQEAKKYPTAEEFVKAHTQSHLMDLSNYDAHRIGRAFDEFTIKESAANFLNGTSELGSLDSLKYDNPAVYKAITAPGDSVTIYRAVPKNAPDNVQIGDYIALEKRYAQMHLDSVLQGEQKTPGKVVSMEVPKSDVIWMGNDFNEWVYSPQKLRDQFPGGLTDIWKKVNGK